MHVRVRVCARACVVVMGVELVRLLEERLCVVASGYKHAAAVVACSTKVSCIDVFSRHIRRTGPYANGTPYIHTALVSLNICARVT